MSPTLKKILMVVGGAFLLVFLAGSRRGSSSGVTYNDPETGQTGRAHLGDLVRSLTTVSDSVTGYDPCNWFHHLPTGNVGTLWDISVALGLVDPETSVWDPFSVWGGSVEDIQTEGAWELFFHRSECTTLVA